MNNATSLQFKYLENNFVSQIFYDIRCPRIVSIAFCQQFKDIQNAELARDVSKLQCMPPIKCTDPQLNHKQKS